MTSVATSAASEPPTPDVANRRGQGTGGFGALLLSPTFLVLGLVVVYPILAAVRLAFYQRNDGMNPETGRIDEGDRFVGIDNVTAMFNGSDGAQFLNAMANTTQFMVINVILETVVGVAMALIMHKAFKGRGLIRASILVPWAIPTAISGLLWRFAFQADGVVNELLPGAPVLWTVDAWQAKLTVIAADTWKTAPFIGLLVLAGLQVISTDVYEAAKVDGASPWRTFWSITLPLVRPALVVAVLFRLLDVLRMFDLPYTLIGPGKGSVETVSMLSFDQAIKFGNYGLASAYALALFLYICVVAFAFLKVLGADVTGSWTERR